VIDSGGGAAAGVLAMAVRALAIAMLTFANPNSLSILSEGGLVPSKLRGWGVNLTYAWNFMFCHMYFL
jgi:hypothetical protein